MTLIQRTKDDMRGCCRIYNDNPNIEQHCSVYYLPHQEDGNWGIFDSQDQIVELAVERGFDGMTPLRQIPVSTSKYSEIDHQLPTEQEYIYGGRFVYHFGHFIIETLARFWPFEDGFLKNQRIVMHGDGTPDDWFANRHVREIFGVLGLTQENIIHSKAPVKIHKLLVTEPAFRPQAQGYKVFADLCHRIGSALTKDLDCSYTNSRPIYLSKTKLRAGVARWQNEEELETALVKNGVEIVHPQSLSVAGHIQMLLTREVVCGVIGSAHHVSIFGLCCARFVLLSPERLSSNFFLIDELNDNRSEYYFAQGTHNVPNTGHGFIVERIIENPIKVALALMDRF